MADIPGLQAFAATNWTGMTRPLSSRQVARLAEYWLPEMRFYWDERFHPVTLDDIFDMVEIPFAQLPAGAKDAWRVGKFVRTGGDSGAVRAFDPPVVHVPDGVVSIPGGPQGNQFRSAVRVLNEGSPARGALRLPEADSDAVVTHGASFRTSNQFFGPLSTLSGTNTSAPGDPFLPRADEPDPARPGQRRPRVTAMAAFLSLLDLLRYELTIAEAEAEPGFDYPPDALRRGFGIVGNLLRADDVAQPPDFPPEDQRKFLLAAIAAHEAGEQIPRPPEGWRLDRVAWNAVTRFAFLEYYFFYAYNDFERYQTAIFDNEHEGDDEGCCLVFDREALAPAAASGDPEAILRVLPHSIITSVHEEYQDADLLKFFPTPPSEGPAREQVDVTVYIAGGSHATYLTPGTHDLVDFQDTWGYVDENAPLLYLLAPLVLALSIILAILEHFIDTEDFTSEEGVHAGPEDVVGNHPAKVAARVLVLPMSANNHIYRPQHEALLALRSFAGKWGGHDGIVDTSPPFAVKTARYFRKLLDKL